jgi:hypothetical protein
MQLFGTSVAVTDRFPYALTLKENITLLFIRCIVSSNFDPANKLTP